jgi:hypothetical protein
MNIENINTPKGLKFPSDLGATIWLFAGNKTRVRIMRALQQRGYPAIWETDDNYTVPDDARQSDWKKWTDGTNRHSYDLATKGAQIADAVIVSTDELANVYEKHNKNIHVCRNCVDPKDWFKPKPNKGDVLEIGWAASASHLKDMQLLGKAVTWLEGRKDIRLTVFGPLAQHFPAWVRKVPWNDSLKGYRKSLRGIDVFLTPIRRHPFTDCRSDIKALEAVMAGGCVAVAAGPVFQDWHDKAHVCGDENGWLMLLQHFVNNPHEVEVLKEKQRSYVLGERTIDKGVSQWSAALDSLAFA